MRTAYKELQAAREKYGIQDFEETAERRQEILRPEGIERTGR